MDVVIEMSLDLILFRFILLTMQKKISMNEIKMAESLQEKYECGLFDLVAGADLSDLDSFKDLVLKDLELCPEETIIVYENEN